MKNIAQNERTYVLNETRNAFAEACRVLGYTEPNREAEEVIDILGVTEDGKRQGRLAPFYPASITEAVDKAAHLLRKYPEALLSDDERDLLDFVLKRVTS
jgi:hypothetical protein